VREGGVGTDLPLAWEPRYLAPPLKSILGGPVPSLSRVGRLTMAALEGVPARGRVIQYITSHVSLTDSQCVPTTIYIGPHAIAYTACASLYL